MDSTPVDPQFVLEHAAHVRALASRLVFDGARADDLEQETWLAALKNAPREMTSPRGWLARIAQRRAMHDWRAESRRAAREHEVARAESVTSSEEILEREETRSQLVRAVLALDEPYRSALVAQFLEERASSEAARQRGVPVETQRTHVKRGLELLRERLKRSQGAAFGAFQLTLVRDLRLEAPFATTFVAAGSGLLIGGLSMATAKKVAAVVLVALAAWIGFARPWEAVEAPTSVGADAAEIRLAGGIEVARPATAEPRVAVAPFGELEASAAASGSEALAVAAVVVLARVVDENGRPIAGATGRLASSSGSWNASTSADESFVGTSGDDGVLRIEALATTSTRVELTIDGGPWRTRASRSFDAKRLDPIVPGTNDAGELMLRPAGRIRGRISADGEVVQPATVRASSPVWIAAEITTNAEPDGSFMLDSVDPSVNELVVTVRRTMTRLAVVAVDVHAGIELDVGEITLERAPTIEGRVLDGSGEPIANVVVGARQAGAMWGEHVTTAVDGSFIVRVPTAGDYDLSVSTSQPFVRPWVANGMPAARFAAGERDARIVLERVPATTFRVVTEDGAPVLEFGLFVRAFARGSNLAEPGDDGVEYDEQSPLIAAHDTNEVVEPAAPDLHEVFVAARGFVPLRAAVAYDTAGQAQRIQTLRLERGRALRGRVVRDGAALANAQVVVERAWVPLGPAPSQPGSIEPGHTHAHDVASFAGRSRSVVTASDGTFTFTGMPAGTYDVRVALGGEVVARVDLAVVRADMDLDVGDLVVRTGATLRGVLDAGGQSPIGWTIEIRGRASLVVDRSDGRFEFTGVESGPVELAWYHEGAIGIDRPSARTAKPPRSMAVDLVDGRTHDVRIDVADLVPARLSITARMDGAPLVDVLPVLVTRTGDGWQSTGRGMLRADGTWNGLLLPGLATSLHLASPDGLLLVCTEDILLAPGEERALVIDVRTGTLEVRLPDDLVSQGFGAVRVVVLPEGMRMRTMMPADWTRTPRIGGRPSGTWDGPGRVSGRIGEGAWTARVEVFPAQGASSPNDDGLLIPAVERTITIRAGETTVIDLR